jgi:hypothetical protein
MNVYNRLAVLSIDEVVAHITGHLHGRKARIMLNGQSVGVTSVRLRTFALAHQAGRLCCAGCGMPAAFFAIERNAYGDQTLNPHLNLYGMRAQDVQDGVEVLFTHDHILARGLGGADHVNNTQPMCSPCNAAKAVGEQKLVDERKAKKDV